MEKGNVICKEHGYEHSLVNTKSKAQERLTRAELALAAKGEISWKDKLEKPIEDAKEQAILSSSEFIWLMKDNFGVKQYRNTKMHTDISPEILHGKMQHRPSPCHEPASWWRLHQRKTIVNYERDS